MAKLAPVFRRCGRQQLPQDRRSAVVGGEQYAICLRQRRQFGGGSGNVVQISPSTGAVLQTFFFNGKNGSYPWSLIQAKDGTFAGTTAGGGTVSKGTPDGVVFTLNASLPPPSR
jgi:hypothetical protein